MMNSFEKRLLDELEDPSLIDSSAELKTIISEVNLENQASNILYKGKYQVLLLENLLPWQKPIGQFFQTVIAICGAKPKKFSSTEDSQQYESHLSDEEADGSPLPVVFDSLITTDSDSSSVLIIKQLKEKYHLHPLSENIGRKLLMICNIIGEEFQIPYPVIAMCHGRNPKSVSIMGTLKSDKFVQVVVNSRGAVSKHEQLPKLSAVKLSHLSGFVPLCTSIETLVYARYDVLASGKEGVELLPAKGTDVVMECYWSNPSAMLEPISTDCICYVKVKSVLGDDDTGASEKFKEVKLIMALHEGIDTGVMKWPEFCSCENLMLRVEDFMKDEVAALLKKQKTLSPLVDLESFDAVVLEKRRNLDFTDRLWLVLKDCSSCDELIEAFKYVFEELSGLMDLPFVYHKNSSTIAVNIKNMREKVISWPLVTSHLALQMLLEIGIEKLRGDYTALFAGLELVPYDSINHFLQPEIISSEAVSCLQKLHSTLELTIIGLKCLLLPKLLLSEFVRNVLKYYSTVPVIDLEHVFKFQVPSSKARVLLDRMRPTVWELSLVSSDKDFRKQTVHHYSTSPLPEHVYAPKDYHPKLMLKNASYVYMTGTLIEDSFFVR